MIKFKSRVPSKDQLKKVLETGIDNRDNELILTNRCTFVLRKPSQVTDDVVVRNKIFKAGQLYVGKEAVADTTFINYLFCSFLEKWILYRNTGEMNMFLTDRTNKTELELFKELEE